MSQNVRIYDRPKRADGLGHSREWVIVGPDGKILGVGDSVEEAKANACVVPYKESLNA